MIVKPIPLKTTRNLSWNVSILTNSFNKPRWRCFVSHSWTLKFTYLMRYGFGCTRKHMFGDGSSPGSLKTLCNVCQKKQKLKGLKNGFNICWDYFQFQLVHQKTIKIYNTSKKTEKKTIKAPRMKFIFLRLEISWFRHDFNSNRDRKMNNHGCRVHTSICSFFFRSKMRKKD